MVIQNNSRFVFLCLIVWFTMTCAPAFGQVDTLKKQSPYKTDVREWLVGQTPGVVVTSSVGAPGMTPSVFIHGLQYDGQVPVYVVDGVRVQDLGALAPESIEAIQVLSGAEAMILYGPSAANGALVVTTRRASRDGFHASYSFAGAVQQLAWEPAQISFREWANYDTRYTDPTRYQQSPYNFQSRIGSSFSQTHHLDLQYGAERFRAAATADFLDNDGPFEGRVDTHRRFSGTLNLDYRPLDWLHAALAFSAGKSNVSTFPDMAGILVNVPVEITVPPYDPLVSAVERSERSALTGRVMLEFFPLPGLSVRADLGYHTSRNSVVNGNSSDWKFLQYSLESSYRKSFGAHSIQLGLLLRGQSESLPVLNGKAVRWGDGNVRAAYDWNHVLSLGGGFYLLKSRTESVAYSYTVPYVHLGLSLADMPFLRRALPEWWKTWDWKASWSKTNPYEMGYPAMPYEIPGLLTARVESSRFDIGTNLVFTFEDSQWALSAGWFSDQDANTPVNSTLPLRVRNRGWLFDTEWSGQAGDFRYAAGASLTLYRNRCMELPGGIYAYPYNIMYGNAAYILAGQPLGVAWAYPYAGVNEYGLARYDTPSGYAEDNSRTAFGNGVFPTATLGLRLDLGWRRWSLSATAHGNFGQSVYRADTMTGTLIRHYLVNSWLPEAPSAMYPQFAGGQDYSFMRSTAALQDGSFFRIDMVRLGYSLPVRRIRGSVDVFASLENFFLFTSYPGSDPEYTLTWDDTGMDLGTYPSTRRIVFGLKFSL